MSSRSPISQWGAGSKSKAGRSSVVRSTTFSSSSLPTGTSSPGMLGSDRRRPSSSSSTERVWASSSLMRPPTCRISSMSSGGFCFEAPICRLTSLRRARRSSPSCTTARRSPSRRRMRSTSTSSPRNSTARRTRSVSSRIISILSNVPVVYRFTQGPVSPARTPRPTDTVVPAKAGTHPLGAHRRGGGILSGER